MIDDNFSTEISYLSPETEDISSKRFFKDLKTKLFTMDPTSTSRDFAASFAVRAVVSKQIGDIFVSKFCK